MYQSSPFTSNTNLALPEFVEIMFLDTSNFCKVSAEPLTTTTDCVNSDELRYAFICFVSSTEPLSFVLKLRLYSILSPTAIDSDVYSNCVPVPA